MSTNRLFMFDPETNEAVCIGKGYSDKWITGVEHVDKWFDSHKEYTGAIDKTRFSLITENELDNSMKITYEEP